MTATKTSGWSRSVILGVFLAGASLAAPENGVSAIAMFAADCSTPKSTFDLGETACARVDGLTGLRLAWVNAEGFILHRAEITSDPQFESFTLPGVAQSAVGGTLTTNHLGLWRASAITTRSSTQRSASFTVKDPNNARADLAVVNEAVGGLQPVAGASFQYEVTLLNQGPDAAVNTRFAFGSVSNATFSALRQTSGPQFACSASACTIASFPAGSVATFELDFIAGGAGGVVEGIATIASDTTEIRPADNDTPAPRLRVASGGADPTCNLGCSGNIVVSANTTNNGARGAVVSFEAPEASGSCGPVTLSPASGSFFPLGVTNVSASASGGGLCSFTVSVVETPPPSITCPQNLSVAALSGAAEAFVPEPGGAGSNPGKAEATGSNVTVSGERSDDRPLSDPYPIGLTPILWRAIDDGGRLATCVQRIIVTSPEAPVIQCPGSRKFRAPSGACELRVNPEEIGVPTTNGRDVVVTFRRSDELALTDPFPAGLTQVTWTATNLLGLASCVQQVFVATDDRVAPELSVPPDVTTTTSSCFAILDDELGVATAKDNCDVTIARTGVPLHFVFPTGVTNVTYTATDAAGNSTSAVQRVTVLESPVVRPSIAPPPDVVVGTGPGATACGVVVSSATLGNATASDNCAGVSVARQGVPANNFFPIGETLVRYQATDAAGNMATATQKVTVTDTTPPSIQCPANIVLEPACPTGAVARWTAPTAADNCAGIKTSQTGGPASGTVFPIDRTTTVSYAAVDAAGNATSCSFTVQVLSVVATIERLKAAVAASPLNGPTKQGLLPKLESALSALEKDNRKQACQMISNFMKSAQKHVEKKELAPNIGRPWLTTAVRLMNALGCTDKPCN